MKTQVNQIDFRGQIIYVGIDVHKNSWKVAILWRGELIKVFSQLPEPQILARHLKKHYPGAQFHCGYEAGFCGFWIQEQFASLGINCEVLHAADIPTNDKERRQKTDARDCRKIAGCLANPLTQSIHIPSKQLQHDRSVVRARTKISRDHTRVRNRINSHIHFYGLPLEMPAYWSRRHVDSLWQWAEQEGDTALALMLEELELLRSLNTKALRQLRLLAKQEAYIRFVKHLTSIPGMGLVHSMCFLTEIGDVRRFKTLDQLCSMIGLIPTTNASGEKQGVGRITKRGKARVKNVIIEAAWVAVRCDQQLARTFEHLCQRMKKNQAIIRIAKKLVNRIRTVLLQDRPYVHMV